MPDSNPMKLPDQLKGVLDQITLYLNTCLPAFMRPEALKLWDQAINKAKSEKDYAKRMDAAFLHGSTIEIREVLSDFGDYLAHDHDEMPYYRHRQGVNSIDTAVHHLRLFYVFVLMYSHMTGRPFNW